MSPIHKKRLTLLVAAILVLAVVGGLMLYALRQNINLFYTPNQLVQAQPASTKLIRVGGMVVKGSLHRLQDHLQLEFQLTDLKSTVSVHYAGILPDLFREGQGIVAIGYWDANQQFNATEVLAKHDEKYMPPGVVLGETS